MASIYLSVRDFSLPIPRNGSIESHSGYNTTSRLGQKTHDDFLRKRSSEKRSYATEVKVEHEFKVDDYTIIVSGRIDGLLDAESAKTIEEVKTDYNPGLLLKKVTEDSAHPYLLQLRSYGYFLYKETGEVPDLRLLIVSQKDGSSQELSVPLNIDGYEIWLEDRLGEVILEYERYQENKSRRKKCSKKLSFPFDTPRIGQEELISVTEEALTQGESLLLQAPTGLGKTAGVMFPAIKNSLSRGGQLVYVTPKNSQQIEARKAIELLQKQRPEIKALVLTAKAKLCPKTEVICNPDYCQFARNYYGKVHKNGLLEKLAEFPVVDAEIVTEFAHRFEVCPFELSLDSVKNTDVIVGDYNYVFSPRSISGRFQYTMSKRWIKPNLVVDEAHNLPSRAQSYYSATISSDKLKSMRGKISRLSSPLVLRAMALVDRCSDEVSTIGRAVGASKGKEITLDVDRFKELFKEVSQLAGEYVSGITFAAGDDPLLEFYNELEAFASCLDYSGEEFRTIYTRDDSGSIKILCCDAARMLSDIYRNFHATVAFSATLKPFEYFRDLTGLGFTDNNLRELELHSPFPKRNRKLMIIPQVSTRFVDREKNYRKVKEVIERVAGLRRGNYAVFFPSFAFLERVRGIISLADHELIVQERGMKSSDVEQLLGRLREPNSSAVLFAVQGGALSEGVDFPGDMLSGAIIVGPGIPAYDLERQVLIRYYQERYGSGDMYGMVVPAMTKVIQSAGRVIRSQCDRGLIVLMDRRFLDASFSSSMPVDWFEATARELVSARILADISDFWRSHESENYSNSVFDETSLSSEAVKLKAPNMLV